jgi:hypothetical protein
MRLDRTRELLRLLPVEPSWPPPAYPPFITERGLRVLRALKSDESSTVDPDDVWSAVDEWMLSSDRDELSAEARSLCGIATLELFAAEPSCPRGSPSVNTAVTNVLFGYLCLPRAAQVIVTETLNHMLRGAIVELEEYERCELALAAKICESAQHQQVLVPPEVVREWRFLLSESAESGSDDYEEFINAGVAIARRYNSEELVRVLTFSPSESDGHR